MIKQKDIEERAEIFRKNMVKAAEEYAEAKVEEMDEMLHHLFAQAPKLENEVRETLKALVRNSFAAGSTYYAQSLIGQMDDIIERNFNGKEETK